MKIIITTVEVKWKNEKDRKYELFSILFILGNTIKALWNVESVHCIYEVTWCWECNINMKAIHLFQLATHFHHTFYKLQLNRISNYTSYNNKFPSSPIWRLLISKLLHTLHPSHTALSGPPQCFPKL